jgi:hypothetical protein
MPFSALFSSKSAKISAAE